jgi:hypothetical protein
MGRQRLQCAAKSVKNRILLRSYHVTSQKTPTHIPIKRGKAAASFNPMPPSARTVFAIVNVLSIWSSFYYLEKMITPPKSNSASAVTSSNNNCNNNNNNNTSSSSSQSFDWGVDPKYYVSVESSSSGLANTLLWKFISTLTSSSSNLYRTSNHHHGSSKVTNNEYVLLECMVMNKFSHTTLKISSFSDFLTTRCRKNS